MPKVSEEHLEQRRRQILDAARRCFGRKGFHQTSMQDVFKESGLSAGAVYRYFKSKEEIVRAIAVENQGLVTALLEEILNEETLPPLEDVVGRFAARVESLLVHDGPLRLAPAGWVEAMHNPALSPTVRELLTDTREWWVKLAERMRDAGHLPADADPRAVGATLFCLVPGFVIQKLILEDVDAAALRAGVGALTGRTRDRLRS
ncbi:TetR/AcrR family transcriptional regulator [Actinoallomurus sp. NPDC052308]|uniref:TetR/AcrR family transcriptional regulator n=1 Tax=Actinoallomurus sp. NPDC052308 TaxID=3155530 RepID=UPI003442C4CE